MEKWGTERHKWILLGHQAGQWQTWEWDVVNEEEHDILNIYCNRTHGSNTLHLTSPECRATRFHQMLHVHSVSILFQKIRGFSLALQSVSSLELLFRELYCRASAFCQSCPCFRVDQTSTKFLPSRLKTNRIRYIENVSSYHKRQQLLSVFSFATLFGISCHTWASKH